MKYSDDYAGLAKDYTTDTMNQVGKYPTLYISKEGPRQEGEIFSENFLQDSVKCYILII